MNSPTSLPQLVPDLPTSPLAVPHLSEEEDVTVMTSGESYYSPICTDSTIPFQVDIDEYQSIMNYQLSSSIKNPISIFANPKLAQAKFPPATRLNDATGASSLAASAQPLANPSDMDFWLDSILPDQDPTSQSDIEELLMFYNMIHSEH